MVKGSHLAECLGNILHLEQVFHWTTSLFSAARGFSPALQRLLVRLSWEMRQLFAESRILPNILLCERFDDGDIILGDKPRAGVDV